MNQDVNIRPFREEDSDDIVALYDRAAAVDPGIGPVPRPMWQRFVRLPQNLDGRDFRVAERDRHLIGLAESLPKDQGHQKVRFFKLVVDPAARRQGVGSALLANLLAIDRPSHDLFLQALSSRDWRAGISFLNALGFSHIESEIGMRCSHLTPPSPALPSGISFERVADPLRYAADVARIHNAAYRSDASFRPFTPEEKAHVLENAELWVASDSGHVFGFCILESEQETVFIENIAIDPACQAKGLGTALAYRALMAAGVGRTHTAGLTVSSKNPAALKVYRRLGFEPRSERCRFSALHSDVAALFARRAGLTCSE